MKDIINFEKIAEIVKEIRELEEKMIKLDYLAKSAINTNYKLHLLIKDPTKKKKIVDEDGSLNLSEHSNFFYSVVYGIPEPQQAEDTTILKHEITDVLLLRVITVLMEDYKKKREYCIQELTSLY